MKLNLKYRNKFAALLEIKNQYKIEVKNLKKKIEVFSNNIDTFSNFGLFLVSVFGLGLFFLNEETVVSYNISFINLLFYLFLGIFIYFLLKNSRIKIWLAFIILIFFSIFFNISLFSNTWIYFLEFILLNYLLFYIYSLEDVKHFFDKIFQSNKEMNNWLFLSFSFLFNILNSLVLTNETNGIDKKLY